MSTPAPQTGTRNFLVTATTPTGKRQSRIVAASSTPEAVRVLAAAGYSDVTLHTDELVSLHDGPGIDLTPAERIAFFAATPQNVWKVKLRVLLRRHGLWFLWPVIGTMILILALSTRSFNLSHLILVLLIVAPVALILRTLFGPDGTVTYRDVLQAGVDGRWEDAIDLLPSLERCMKRMPPGPRELELTRLHAQALARLGRGQEGLDMLLALRGHPDIDQNRLLGVLGDTCSAARRFENAGRCYQDAVNAFPDSSNSRLQLAEFQVKHLGDANAAAESLACIDEQAITPQTAIGIQYVRGLIAIENRQDRAAAEYLGPVLAEIERLAQFNPPASVMAAFTAGYLAIAEARLGQHTRAAARWEAARTLIDRHAPDRLKRLGADYLRATAAPAPSPAAAS